MTDNIWKGISLVSSLIVVPLFMWVWGTNTKIETLRNDYQHTVTDVVEHKAVLKKIEEEQNSMETDIRLIQQKLDIVAKNTEEIMKMMKEKSSD